MVFLRRCLPVTLISSSHPGAHSHAHDERCACTYAPHPHAGASCKQGASIGGWFDHLVISFSDSRISGFRSRLFGTGRENGISARLGHCFWCWCCWGLSGDWNRFPTTMPWIIGALCSIDWGCRWRKDFFSFIHQYPVGLSVFEWREDFRCTYLLMCFKYWSIGLIQLSKSSSRR